MAEKICGECRWHCRDDSHPSDWLCTNNDSDYCAEYTGYEDSCGCWEGR